MSRSVKFVVLATLSVAALVTAPAGAQGFGANKEKVTLHRKLPAVVRLPGNSIKVTVTADSEDGALPYDFQAVLETELLKDDPDLREDDNPNTAIACRITQYEPPHETDTTAPAVALVRGAPTTQTFQRVSGDLIVSFQAKTADGRILASDNVSAKYDEQFDSSGISTSNGVKGSLSGTWNKLKGKKTADNTALGTSEVRSKLIIDAVQQIAEHIVNSDEAIDVLLARKDGPLEEGDKDALTGLWERALETFETAPAFPKPDEDAYRLYDIGVAYEALAYEADDEKIAMKYLDQAAINYGKAIDSKPTEKYFVEPQKRIETAIAHYKELQKEFLENNEMRDAVLQCVQSQGFILGQLAACNRLHEAEQRLARWLLMVRDRVQSENYYLTQEFLANMLGARRTTVTAAAGELQRRGLISYSRGRIRIVDPEFPQSNTPSSECLE